LEVNVYERQSLLLTSPGATAPLAKVPANIERLTPAKWAVRMMVDAPGRQYLHDVVVLASTSEDATEQARANFYGQWATKADRDRMPLRVVELLQVGV
jgi:hypothetical protein